MPASVVLFFFFRSSLDPSCFPFASCKATCAADVCNHGPMTLFCNIHMLMNTTNVVHVHLKQISFSTTYPLHMGTNTSPST